MVVQNQYSRVRLLRRIGKKALREKEKSGLVQSASTELDCVSGTSMELVTIDTIKMLKGEDKKRMLIAWHDWKARQKMTDKVFANRELRKIYRVRAILKDPKGFYAKQRRYHEMERERLHSSPEWIATHNKPRRKKTLEEKRATKRDRYNRHKNDPVWRAKRKADDQLRYYNNNKDIPGWVDAFEQRKKRHAEILAFKEGRRQRRIARQMRDKNG